MGSWSYSRFGVTVDKSKEKLARQLMKCLDIPLNDYEYNWAELESSRDLIEDYPDIIGSADGFEEIFQGTVNVLYDIMLRLWGHADVYFTHEEGSSVSDYYNRFECVFKSENNKMNWATCIFCDGDNTVGAEGANPYCLLKDEIEETARKKNIPIAWVEEFGELNPDCNNDAFYNLAFQIYLKRHDEIATERGEQDINAMEIDEEYIALVNHLMAAAKESGYQELAELLMEKFADIIEDSDFEIAESAEDEDDSTQMNDQEKAIYRYVREHDGLIIIDLAIADFPHETKSSMKTTIEKLCDKGVLERREFPGAYSFPY